MKTFRTMLKTEIKLSLRGMDMFIFAICVPLVVLIIQGIIYGNRPAYPDAGYTFLEQSFSALATISICAGGVMGLPLVVSDYRSKGILKRYKVTPVSPAMILVVQVAIYTLYAVVSLMLLYFTAKLFFGYQFRGDLFRFLGGYLLVLVSMFSIGMLVGGVSPDTKIASVIACILYFPMLILSGATLPYEVMPSTLKRVADVMPLTQGIKLLKAASLGHPADSVLAQICIMGVVAVACTVIAVKYFKWE
ncbi:ABC transporter permease [Bariatricus massiliensis]|uniref:Transport permease protein n=1 Tax=Bariatricus massiliensis TaxID=1745713 RepID=A0ABS8DD55_9FIRM|nr:ABC transporter permease [Bariatricus massiliensis]MCB7303535.1 ABC transporter permease [Bariatricus massiliensis]MCB7373667.1 ABC transporter permease [Bariatricus massiliensis]MCB7386337.1 ABC transporter permease [Bariatricus massiliensis]MCB7410499.1 ABC transporter permease [Bariatricus massiliensis]MCQ5252217.1 ABC transporter permease [Bariatricus massiliensis]